jgi:hypothetical protein
MVGEDLRELGEEENERILGQNRCAHYIPSKIECTDLVPCRSPPARWLASRLPIPSQRFQLHVPHPLHPLRVDFRRYGRLCTRTGWIAPESPPLRARSLHGRQPSPSGFNSTFHTPCTRCRSISAGTVGRARERAGSPQIRPPCALACFTPSIEFGIAGNRQTRGSET